jgi:hypothetical protein
MFRFIGLCVVLFLALPLQAATWSRNKIWDDGRAEVAVYESQRFVYGKPRMFKEQLIVVKEDFRKDTLVKADDPKKQDTLRVFKLNQSQKLETENYPYSYLTSVFMAGDDLQKVVKLTVGSQEWCGNTFKVYKSAVNNLQGELTWHSYFDGEADQTVTVNLEKDDYFDDQLPLVLRTLPFKPGFQKKIRLWDNLTTSHASPLNVVEATLTVEDGGEVRCRAGTLPSWKVTVQKPAGVDTYWFEKKEPNILTKMEAQDGRTRLLYGRARWSYWDRRLPAPNVLK